MSEIGHLVSVAERRRVTVSGVSEILSFEEDGAAFRTSKGILVLRGEGLKLKLLSPDGGQVLAEGDILSVSYEAPKAGLFSRLFG